MDGGSISRKVTATVKGKTVEIVVVTSKSTVEIGGAAFDRDELLIALGVNPDTGAVV